MPEPTRENVHNRMKELGHVVFDENTCDMNVVGLRRVGGRTDHYDDLMTLSWKVTDTDLDNRPEEERWEYHRWPCTTDPGGKYLVKPLGSLGTAVLRPGQYRGSHKLGTFAPTKTWAHEALIQCGTLKLWHDGNKDNVVDYGQAETTSTPASGICIHRPLGDFSAGCQVFQSRVHFEQFIQLCKLQVIAGLGGTFTYTLLDWEFPDGT